MIEKLGARFRILSAGASPEEGEGFALEVRRGLGSPRKSLPCRFIYDARGSRLFEEICRTREYYLRRAERGILEGHAREIVSRLREGSALVELGSGSAVKTRLLIKALLEAQERLCFVPIDISRSMLEESSKALLGEHAELEILGIAGEYREGLQRLGGAEPGPKLLIWLGSSIGNLDREEAAAFLSEIRESLDPGDAFLLGIDLRKGRGILESAYRDAGGVTEAFHKNLLCRINRELGGRFRLEDFELEVRYMEEEGFVRSRLRSLREHEVRIEDLDLRVPFAEGEGIHTEDAYKYSLAEIDALAQSSGFRIEEGWLDRKGRYRLSLLRPV